MEVSKLRTDQESSPKLDLKSDRQGPQAQPNPEEPPKARLPIPDAAAQERSLATIRNIYREDYKKPDKGALAAKLLQKAKETQDFTDRFVLLQERGTSPPTDSRMNWHLKRSITWQASIRLTGYK